MKKNFLINRDFGLLFFGRLVSDIGHFLYQFAIGWYVLSLTNSAAQAGYYMAFGGIVYVVLTPLAGVLVDRLDRIKIIYLTDFIRGTSIFFAGLLIITQPVINLGSWAIDFGQATMQLIVLYITAFVFSVNGALFAPAVTASIPYLVKDEELLKANSLNSGLHAFVSIVGGILAGVLYSTLGIGFIFILTSVSYLLSAISEMFIRTKSHERNNQALTVTLAFKEFSEGFLFILQKQGMLMFVIVVLIVNMLAAPLFGVAQPYFFNQIVASEPFYYSLIGFAFSIGSMAMAVILSGKPTQPLVNRPLRRGLLGLTFGVMLNGVIIYLFIEGVLVFWSMFALMILVGIGLGLNITYVNTPIGVALQRYVPKEKLGRVNAIISLMAQGVIPFSTALAGIAIESFSLPLFYGFVALGLGLGTVLAYRSKSLRHF